MHINNSLLHVNEIEKIIHQYFGIKDPKCHLLRSHINDVYEIASFNRRYILKIFSSSKPKEEVVFEIKYLVFLNNKGIMVNTPVSTTDNDKYIALEFPEGKRHAILFYYNNGVEIDYRKASNAFSYGRGVAKLHLASKEYKPSYTNEINIFGLFLDAINIIEIFFTTYKNEQWVFFNDYFQKLINKVKAIDTRKMSMGYIHGDLHGGNSLVNGKEIFFYDFEYSGYGLICYELSIFRWSTLIGNREPQWEIFLNGYRSLISISDRELHHSMVMVCIRDILVFANTVNMTDKLGVSSIHNYYIQNRLEFIKKMTNILQI